MRGTLGLLVLLMVAVASLQKEEEIGKGPPEVGILSDSHSLNGMWPFGEVRNGKWPPSEALEKLWPESEAFMLQLEEWFGSPTHSAERGIPKLLFSEKEEEEEEEGLRQGGKSNPSDDYYGIYLPSTNGSIVHNWRCRRDVASIRRVLEDPSVATMVEAKGHFWHRFLSDSWGKMPDGILYGNILPWGMMEECTMLSVDEVIRKDNSIIPIIKAKFEGNYCLVTYKKTGKKSMEIEEDPEEISVDTRLFPLVKGKLVPSWFQYGTCMPSTCTEEDFRVSLNAVLEPSGKVANDIACQTRFQQRKLDSDDIVFIVFISILGFLVLAGAVVDISINHWKLHHYRKGPLRYLLAFSGYTNMSKIFAINNNEHPDVISCLHGMRVMSMVWVVWGHTAAFSFSVSTNMFGIKSMADDVIDQTLINATFSVDTFFFMSGLLATYGCLREFSRAGRVNWVMYYVHRFIRLSPAILVVAGLMATVAKFGMTGPLGPIYEKAAVPPCQKNWWADVLFVTNFLYESGEVPCLGQCWYTAVDTQLYLVLPLVLVPLMYKPRFGVIWLIFVIALSFAIPTIIFAVYSVVPAFTIPKVPEGFVLDPSVDTYGTPWCRASPYVIGALGGWILYQMRGKKLPIKAWMAVIGWMLAIALGLTIIYGINDYNTLNWDVRKTLTDAVIISYGGLSRGAWAVALLWVVIACHKGFGGPINAFLSHPSWQPMSRLTYMMFISSITIQLLYISSIYRPLYMNHLNKIMETLGYLFIIGLVSVVLSLLTEGPVLGLKKIMCDRAGHKREEANLSNTADAPIRT